MRKILTFLAVVALFLAPTAAAFADVSASSNQGGGPGQSGNGDKNSNGSSFFNPSSGKEGQPFQSEGHDQDNECEGSGVVCD